MKIADLILESAEQQMAADLAKEMEAEFGKEGEQDVNESVVVGILSWALASNTILDVLGKYAAIALRKMNLNKAADKADAVHKWAHNNEKNIVNVLSGFIKPFVRDEKKRQLVAKGLFIAILAGLGVKAGIGAMNALKGGGLASASVSAVKAALKGRDIAVIGSEIAGAVGATAAAAV